MKTLLSFMAGSLVTTLAVVFAGGYHAGMVILGAILAALALLLTVRMLGVTRVARWLLALQKANSETVYLERGARKDRSSDFVVGAPQGARRQAGDIRRSRAGRNVVTLPKVLDTVQQEVLSALVNQGLAFPKAERLVLEAYWPGDSFDDLFRKTMTRRSA
jgi:hypothetical protein